MVKEDKEKNTENKNNKLNNKPEIYIKEKIIIFIIGFLVGAIVAISGCIIYNKVITSKEPMIEQNDFNNNHFPGMNGERQKDNSNRKEKDNNDMNLPSNSNDKTNNN